MTIHIRKHKFEWTSRSICTQARSLTLNTSKIIENCYESKPFWLSHEKTADVYPKKMKCHRSHQNSWKKNNVHLLNLREWSHCYGMIFAHHWCNMTRRPAPAIVPWHPWSPAKPLSSAWLLWPDVLGVCSNVGRPKFPQQFDQCIPS